VNIHQVPELGPPDVFEKSGALGACKALAHIPVAKVDQMGDADAINFGPPTSFGSMCAQI
jgi:hypothetical protein